MSRFGWICTNCGAGLNKHISIDNIGRNPECEWVCDNCGYKNTLRLKGNGKSMYKIKRDIIKDIISRNHVSTKKQYLIL